MKAVELFVDGSAARHGGGVSRLLELAAAIPVLDSDLRRAFAAKRPILNRIGRVDSRAELVPAPDAMAARLAWQHAALPHLVRRSGARWLLSPFNVLPLGPGLATRTRRAVIVSNLAPFIPALAGDVRGYRRARLAALRSLTMAALDRAMHVFFLSAGAQRLLSRHVRGTATRLPMSPPPPADIEAASTASLPPELVGRSFFVLVGDLMPHKGIEDIILAGADLKLEADVLICGAPVDHAYSMRCRRLAETAGPSVQLIGAVPRKLAMALMKAAVATVICSRVENTSRVPVEAMALGSPIIASDVPISRETCGDAARYYPVNDHAALSRAMRELMEDHSRRSQLVGAGHHQLDGRDWLTATRTILETLEVA